jgi:hypothetical protein
MESFFSMRLQGHQYLAAIAITTSTIVALMLYFKANHCSFVGRRKSIIIIIIIILLSYHTQSERGKAKIIGKSKIITSLQ